MNKFISTLTLATILTAPAFGGQEHMQSMQEGMHMMGGHAEGAKQHGKAMSMEERMDMMNMHMNMNMMQMMMGDGTPSRREEAASS